VAGDDVQYFATVEPQKRLVPHLHMATRGTLSRAKLRQIIAATLSLPIMSSVQVIGLP
jgi:hypothetical protein